MKPLITLFVFIFCLQAGAQAEATDQRRFRIQDQLPSPTWQRPDQFLQASFELLENQISDISLLKWVLKQKIQDPLEPYNRREHFGTWVNDPRDTDCFNTRAKVLIRDSETEVKLRPDKPCSVSEGTWNDPYSGQTLSHSDQVQVDHSVPLKNAYASGAWAWSQKKRCLYANYTGNDFHLLTVQAHENLSKGDSSPEDYLPSNRRYICQYLQNWLKIKLIWNLELAESEAQSIRQHIHNYGCATEDFRMPKKEMLRQRASTESLQVICKD